MANLLKDLLPDAPREVSILVAAAEAGVASSLRDRVSHGMDVGTASAVVAGSFAASTPFRPEACNWAVREIAGQGGVALVNHPNWDWALTAEDLPAARGAQLLEIASGHPYVHTQGDADHLSH